MPLQTIILLLTIGLIAGMLSGLIGIGGGVVVVPALIYLLGFGQHEAQGTSLGLLLPPVGILAVMDYYKRGFIDIKVVAVLAVAFVLGGWLGSKLSLQISETVLRKIFAIVVMLIAVKMFFFDR